MKKTKCFKKNKDLKTRSLLFLLINLLYTKFTRSLFTRQNNEYYLCLNDNAFFSCIYFIFTSSTCRRIH